MKKLLFSSILCFVTCFCFGQSTRLIRIEDMKPGVTFPEIYGQTFYIPKETDTTNNLKVRIYFSDTLDIPLGRYKFITIGDKIYKLVTSLEEVDLIYVGGSGIIYYKSEPDIQYKPKLTK